MRETKAFDNFMMGYYNENYGSAFEDFCISVSEFIEMESLKSIRETINDIKYIKENIDVPTVENVYRYYDHVFWSRYHIVLYDKKVEYLHDALDSSLRKQNS
jgi:hypothetical protein